MVANAASPSAAARLPRYHIGCLRDKNQLEDACSDRSRKAVPVKSDGADVWSGSEEGAGVAVAQVFEVFFLVGRSAGTVVWAVVPVEVRNSFLRFRHVVVEMF